MSLIQGVGLMMIGLGAMVVVALFVENGLI